MAEKGIQGPKKLYRGERILSRHKDTHAPDLPELLRVDLKVVQCPSHSNNHLAAVA